MKKQYQCVAQGCNLRGKSSDFLDSPYIKCPVSDTTRSEGSRMEKYIFISSII